MIGVEVAGGGDLWSEYDRWNEAIAEVVFPELDYPTPVYLDLEDEMLEALAERVGVEADAVEQRLARAVAATLDFSKTSLVFKAHTTRLWSWTKRGRAKSVPPPVLALLAVLSLAAERMARGDGFSDNNFYGRLAELLQVDLVEVRMDQAYRRVAERYWGSLNVWLERMGGRRGVPTAFSVSHRYVGLPISQALVRRGDREKLISFFQRFGLSAGSELPPSEMESILDHWMSMVPCPATKNLERLWRSQAARSRIAQTAVVALAAWDGTIAGGRGEGATREAGRLSLGLELSGFPRKRFKLTVLVYAAHPEREREAQILDDHGSGTRVTLVPAIPGALSLGQSAQVEAESLLEGLLQIRDELSDQMLTHRPKRLVVFRQDALSMRWIETEQVLLGDDVMLVAHKDLEKRLTMVLGAIARPGWSLVTDSLPGLPEDWRVFRGVEIFSHPGDLIPRGMNDLSALVPLTSSQLKIAGGFALPGATRGKWHSWSPPEIRAVSDVPEGFNVRLIDLNSQAATAGEYESEPSETLLEDWGDDGDGALVIQLSDYELEDGDYRVELVAKGSSDALSVTHLHLRSAETPDLLQWSVAAEVLSDLADPLAVVGAGRAQGGVVVRGASVSEACETPLTDGAVPIQPWWQGTAADPRAVVAAGVAVARPDPSSCIYTGRHREELEYVPTDSRGRPLTPWSVGRCRGCGLVRRYSTSYYRNKRERERHTAATERRRRDVSLLTRVKQSEDRAWDVVLDGLMHTGGGKWSLLERLAMHIEPTALFVDELSRGMEALGHIEVRRDIKTLQPIEWEVSPTVLAGSTNGLFLSGYWTQGATDAVSEAAAALGGDLEQGAQSNGPASWFVTGLATDEAENLETALEGLTVQAQAWRDIAAALPLMSDVVGALPRRSAEVEGRIRWFDLTGARWVDATDLRRPGAYRVVKFSTVDVVRTEEDVAGSTMAIATVQLSKHAAAMLAGRPLVAYDKKSRELAVPLGADLPGLYGRAAVLASGFLPEPRGRLLVYSDVPAELASHLSHLIAH